MSRARCASALDADRIRIDAAGIAPDKENK